MADHTADGRTHTPRTGGYRERLHAPWWWWPLAAAGGSTLAAELHRGYPGFRAWVPYAAVLLSVAGLLFWLSRATVRIDGERLRAGRAELALRHVGRVEVLDAAGRRRVLGPYGDPAGFALLRPWLSGAVRVEVTDPADPAPYWLVSTRHPDRLAAFLRSAAPGDTFAGGPGSAPPSR